jgi:putative aldouronate transport system permease protein
MLFNGGLIPLYLAIRSLGMIDTIWALILPGAVQVFYIIVMVNFFRGLPEELSEAAIIDGANHWDILFRIFIPLSMPAITTIVLFTAVDHWNAWFDAMIYMTKPNLWPMQTYLQSILMGSNFQNLMANPKTVAMISQGGLRSAHIVLTTLPILLLYPFVQRYFISGLTLGAIKG